MGKKQSKEPVKPENAARQYELKHPLYVQFTEKLRVLLKEMLKGKSIDYDLISGRTKSVDRFRGKLERPDKRYVDPLNDVTDLSGVRVVLYYLDDVDKVCQLVEEEFTVDEANSIDSRKVLKPHEFGYLSVHYVVSLSDARSRLIEWSDYAGLKAEIQIRTVLQHAWASISRALDYTQEHDVPTVLRRRLFRLSGLL